MKVLVTGGAGYIGSHTVLALLQNNYEVVVIDNFSNSSPVCLERVKLLGGKSPLVFEGDLLDRRFLGNVFEEHGDIESVVHFAALKAVGESTAQPLRYYRNNVIGSIVLLEEMEKSKIRNIVFSSSCTVYGEPQQVPILESHPTGKVSSPYGRTKFTMEGIIEDHALSLPGFKAGILRYFNPVGAHPSGEIGEDPNGIPDNLVPFVCQVATGRLEKLRVFGSDYPTADGTAVRDYLHVVDLAEAHLRALQYLKSSEDSFTCNLGTGRGSSVLEVIETFERVTGKKIPYEMSERRPGDVIEAWADPTLARDLLDWQSACSLEEMLADAWRWQQKNPAGYKTP